MGLSRAETQCGKLMFCWTNNNGKNNVGLSVHQSCTPFCIHCQSNIGGSDQFFLIALSLLYYSRWLQLKNRRKTKKKFRGWSTKELWKNFDYKQSYIHLKSEKQLKRAFSLLLGIGMNTLSNIVNNTSGLSQWRESLRECPRDDDPINAHGRGGSGKSGEKLFLTYDGGGGGGPELS